jgi:malonyl-CoA O-methyltransferase
MGPDAATPPPRQADAVASALPPLVDPVALVRARARLLRSPATPWLHVEVARRMAERLAVVKMQPQTVLDWGARAGGGAARLLEAYPRACILAVEPGLGGAPGQGDSAAHVPSGSQPTPALPWWSPRRWLRADAPTALEPGQVDPGQAQLLWANMVLHGLGDPLATLRQWHRALAVDGFLMFSTFGPGTLAELRVLYDEEGWGPPMAPLVDMHDFGDMLVETGFADPVMDQEHIVLTWTDAESALTELRSLGANLHPRRARGLRTPRWRDRLLEGLRRTAGADGRVRLGFEIAYGHAFRPAPRPRVQAEARVDLADLRAMVRAGRRPER